MRKGRESYSELYDKAINLSKKGKPIKEIASELKVSYSACYHWIKGLRKPKKGNMNSFLSMVKKNGPIPAIDIKKEFPKHNELFHIASKRGMGIKRYVLPKKIGDYSTWYFVSGQEEKLKRNILKLMDKYKELNKQLLESITMLR